MKKIKKFKDNQEEVGIEFVKNRKPKKKKKPPFINYERYSKKAYLTEYYQEE